MNKILIKIHRKDAYKELKCILDYIDSMQEEPVSEDLEEAATLYAKEEYSRKNPATLPDMCIGCYAPIIYAFRNGAKWQKAKDESTTEDLSEYINKLFKQFPEVSFTKLSRIAVRVANWQKEQMMAKAIDAELYSDGMFIPLVGVKDREKVSDIKFGDKVKVIIIKDN